MKANKKFLLISSNSSARGGGERYLVFLTQGLISLGVDVHVLLSTVEFMDGWERELFKVGATVHRSKLKGLVHRRLRFVQSILDFQQQKLIESKCREIQPDAIWVNQQYDEDGLDYVMGALRARTCPVAGIMHMPMTRDKNKRPLGWLRGAVLRRWFRTFRYKVVFSSQGGANEFSEYYSVGVEPLVVPSGVPLSGDPVVRPESVERLADKWINDALGAEQPPVPTIGVACQFVPQKNLKLFVEGWLEAIHTGVRSRLLLIGDGPERKFIQNRLASVDKDLWHITGWTDKYSDYLAQLDLFVMTSDFEGLPLTLIEVAGMGTPCIVTNFNGAREVADRARWVQIHENANPQSLGSAIAKRLRELGSEVPASAFEREQFIEYFGPIRMAEDVLGIFGFQALAETVG